MMKERQLEIDFEDVLKGDLFKDILDVKWSIIKCLKEDEEERVCEIIVVSKS